jgi:hypothetical protein
VYDRISVEFRKYHRDEKGKIVKANDHLMDASAIWSSRDATMNGSSRSRFPVLRWGRKIRRVGWGFDIGHHARASDMRRSQGSGSPETLETLRGFGFSRDSARSTASMSRLMPSAMA